MSLIAEPNGDYREVGDPVRLPSGRDHLGIRSLAELIAEEEAAPDPRFLVEPFLLSDDYGAYAAKPKVGKTWLVSDLSVSLGTGTPFLGHYSVPSGRVLFFAGEGGRRRVLRRLDAIARSRGINLADIKELRVSLKAPQVGEEATRRALSEELAAHPADLIIGEPFYLMGRGVGRSQLNEIGAVLGACQEVAQDADSALLIGDHWNKGGLDRGHGAERITGAGMHEWARVLINGMVEDSKLDIERGGTVVTLRWDISGELPDSGFKVRRSVWPDDKADPRSRLNYDCRFLGEHDPSTMTVLSEDASKILMELRARKADEFNPARSNDVRGSANVDSRRASDAWKELEALGKIDRTTTNGSAFEVWLTEEE